MTPEPPDMTDAPDVLDVKKYPNRRFYDASRRRHVTLADLYEQVRAGRQIRVTDSKTGDDITHIVLTQIILEHDPPKLELFPASLLHKTIQSNQQVVRDFIDQYFARAMNAFVESGKRFEEFMQQAGRAMLSPTSPMDWARSMFGGAPPARTPPPPPPPGPAHDAPAQESDSEAPNNTANQTIRELQARLDRMAAELAELRRKPKRPTPSRSGPGKRNA